MSNPCNLPPPGSIAPPVLERPEYPAGVPDKFSVEGVVQKFPGNTLTCHIPANSPLLPSLHTVYDMLKTHSTLSKYIHLLPPSSWHMTVFEGVCDKIRTPKSWPPGKANQTLEVCTKEFTEKLRHLGLELDSEGLSPPYRMCVRRFDDPRVGIALEVEGETAEEGKRMGRLRDVISERLGLRMPNHDNYVFHVSIAYLLRHIDGEDRRELDRVFECLLSGIEREFELGAVEFNTFEDMHAFPTMFYLGR
jgi:hypothetical protein